MRKITTLLLVGLAFLYAAEGFAQRGIGTNLPNRSSVLHLESDTRGLLIPQINLTNGTLDPAPVNNPASSLLIYNTSDQNDVRPGYYYWDENFVHEDGVGTGAWIALLDSNSAGKNIMIDADGTISIAPGKSNHQVLVTIVDDTDPDPNNHTITTEWVNASEILGDLLDIEGGNAISVTQDADSDGLPVFHVELDGNLTKNTIITASPAGIDPSGELPYPEDFSFTIESGANYFHITSLNEIAVNDEGIIIGTGAGTEEEPGDTFKEFFDVLIVNKENGLVQRVSVQDLLKDAIDAVNGLTYDRENNLIKLGGDLIEETTIKLDGNDFVIDATREVTDVDDDGNPIGNLKIKGLEETKTANKIMVVDDATNTVKTVRRVISVSIDESKLVTQLEDYSPHVQEVNITVKKLTSDVDLQFPAIEDSREGQVINVRLDINEESKFYLNLKKDAGTEDASFITYGALPYQGWVLKFNGTEWLVVSSN